MRRRRPARALPSDAPLLREPEYLPGRFRDEIEAAVPRAIAAGAKPPLSFVGIGMTGIVFADRTRNLAYKVARTDYSRGMLEEEVEWFHAAARNESTRSMVPGGVRYHKPTGVLIRQYVHGKPGGEWGDDRYVYDMHDRLDREMVPAGWTAPEKKDDSWVVSRRRGVKRAVLVDGSMPIRVGQTLLRHVLAVASGQKRAREPLADLAFALYRERRAEHNPRGTLSVADVRRGLAALREAGAEFDWHV